MFRSLYVCKLITHLNHSFMKKSKSGVPTCFTEKGLCKHCTADCIKKPNQAYVLLCFNCAIGGETEVNPQLKDSKFLKSLRALCAEI